MVTLVAVNGVARLLRFGLLLLLGLHAYRTCVRRPRPVRSAWPGRRAAGRAQGVAQVPGSLLLHVARPALSIVFMRTRAGVWLGSSWRKGIDGAAPHFLVSA